VKAGELFVEIMVKGAETSKKSFEGLKGSLSKLSDMSLEAKAGILGAMYALERMTAASNNTGNSLVQFENVTGMSLETLQKYQYAARQAGVTNEDLTSSIKGIQSAMTNMLLGHGNAPLAYLSKYVGGFSKEDLKAPDSAFRILQKLQTATQKINPAVMRQLLSQLGVNEGTQSALFQGVFNQKNFDRAPKYNEGEARTLQKNQVAWANLGNKIEMAFGHLNAKHGLEMVKNISMITDSVIKLTESLIKLGESLKVFEVINMIFKGWDLLLSPDKNKGGLAAWAGYIDEQMADFQKNSAFGKPLKDTMVGRAVRSADDWLKTPHRYADAPGAAAGNTNVNIQQNIQHHGDAKDTRAVERAHKEAAKGAHDAIKHQNKIAGHQFARTK